MMPKHSALCTAVLLMVCILWYSRLLSFFVLRSRKNEEPSIFHLLAQKNEEPLSSSSSDSPAELLLGLLRVDLQTDLPARRSV